MTGGQGPKIEALQFVNAGYSLPNAARMLSKKYHELSLKEAADLVAAAKKEKDTAKP